VRQGVSRFPSQYLGGSQQNTNHTPQHGVDVIYHGSYIDEEGMDLLEQAKTKHVVAPAINWLVATLDDAAAFGYSHEKAEQVGYKKELEVALRGLREMHRRGIVVLPGG
jgi:hypothetical protein